MHTVCIGVSSYVVFSMIAYVAWPQLPADVTASRRVVVVVVSSSSESTESTESFLPLSSFIPEPKAKKLATCVRTRTYLDISSYYA